MPGIVMLLSNAFRPDPRVLKEAVSLSASGFEMTILCWDRQAELKSEEVLPSGIKIVRIQNIHSNYGIGARQLWRMLSFWIAAQGYLRKLDPRIIHCHDFDTLLAGLIFGLFHRIPVIYDAHEYYVELVRPRLRGILGWVLLKTIACLENFGARKARAIVTVDQALAAIYQKRNSQVIVLGHYPLKRMARMSNPVFSRSQITLIYAGRISTDRGMLIYCELLKKLLAIGIPARLILAGSFTPDSEKATFFEHAKETAEAIDYLGWIPYEKISDIYHEADIGLALLLPVPRYVAATPVKLFEYMANALPVIASDFPPITQIIKDAQCGQVIDPLVDISATANLIADWWNNKTTPQTLGENGRQAILGKYNWESQVDQLVNLYRALVKT